MGKGVALQMKERFPLNYKLYSKACKNDEVKLGSLFITSTGQAIGPKYIINFPTKGHWRESSKLNYISKGLDELRLKLIEYGIKSVAMPPLGCGNGGLNWDEVKPVILEKLGPIENQVEVFVTIPGTYSYSRKSTKSELLLTKPRALIYKMATSYSVLDFDITHLEIQKLAYFIQEFGQKELKLRFTKGMYGPYSSDLKHLVAYLEGDYFIGQIRFHDMAPTDILTIQRSVSSKVDEFIKETFSPDDLNLQQKLTDFITGFESPIGLELLSSVHWAYVNSGYGGLQEVHGYIENWNERKAKLFSFDQVSVAYNRVTDYFSRA